MLIIYFLTGFFRNNYAMHEANPCLNYKTKTYQIMTEGVDKSKVDSIIVNSKVESIGTRTYENGKLISAFYPPNKLYWMYGAKEQQEQHVFNDKGDIILDVMRLGDQIDSTFYEYNEKGKLAEVRKNIIFFDKPVLLSYKYNYSNDTIYERQYWNDKYERTMAKWEQQKKPKIDVHQKNHPEKSNTLFKYVWDEHLNLTEQIQCENDSCHTEFKIEYLYDDCGRVLRKITSADADIHSIWTIEWNEMIE